MFRNYLKLAYRNLVRRKGFSVINISGLAIGIAACLLLFMVVTFELSYEKFQPNYNRIHHVLTSDKTDNDEFFSSGVPYMAFDALKVDFPEYKFGVLFSSYGSQITVLNSGKDGSADKRFIENMGLFYTDPGFFDVFHYKWLSGSPKVLGDPNTVVLSETQAKKYFGTVENAMGKTLMIDNNATLNVAGVLEDVPQNSDFPLKVLVSFLTAKNTKGLTDYSPDWNTTSSNFQVFALLPAQVTHVRFDEQLAKISDRYYSNHTRTGTKKYNLSQPLSEVHFDERVGNLGDHVTKRSTLVTLSLIGVLIILMACINFINLSTAQAVSRSREVGVRKVLGGRRWQLFGQMMGETAVLVFISSILAVMLAFIATPYVKYVITVEGNLSLLSVDTLLFIAGLMVGVTVLSGIYPAMILSGFKPVMALKNKITSASIGGISLRRVLVITQFAISQMLIIGTIVAVSQMNFIRNADLGFNKDAVYVMQTNADSALRSTLPAFKEAMLQLPGVSSVSFSTDVPSSENSWSTNFAYNHGDDENFGLYLKFADEDYVKTFGLKLLAGRNFVKSDSINEMIVNESLLRKLGIKNPQDAIGKSLRMGRGAWKPIVGVVSDFKTNSLREDIKPTMLTTWTKRYGVVSVKLHTGNINGTVDNIQKTWDKFFPHYANETRFMDESINKFYEQETRLSMMYKIFAGLAIFISCLGLYGLVSFMAVQKTKEVGIRKVLGASIANILYLFSKEFTLLVVLAFLIAAPVAYFMMKSWLSNFVFRIDITVWVFLIAVFSSLLIAWLTVGYKAASAARVNPVKSLKSGE